MVAAIATVVSIVMRNLVTIITGVAITAIIITQIMVRSHAAAAIIITIVDTVRIAIIVLDVNVARVARAVSVTVVIRPLPKSNAVSVGSDDRATAQMRLADAVQAVSATIAVRAVIIVIVAAVPVAITIPNTISTITNTTITI